MYKVKSADGTTIAFDRSGTGPPLILVGGAFSTRDSAVPLAVQLSPRLSTIAYDRRGRGDSGDNQPYAVGREIDDLASLVRVCGGQAFVYGHSSGAALALEAAASGLHARKLALYEPPYTVDDSRPPAAPDFGDRSPWRIRCHTSRRSWPRTRWAALSRPDGPLP